MVNAVFPNHILLLDNQKLGLNTASLCLLEPTLHALNLGLQEKVYLGLTSIRVSDVEDQTKLQSQSIL